MSAELTAKLGLDGKGFAGGLDDAGKKTKSFSDTFKNEMRESRMGVRETQHSIVGMSEAMDGSFKGAINAFRGLSGLIVSNPFLAIGAASAAIATGIIKHWEEVEKKIGEAIEKASEKWKEAENKFTDAMGITQTPSDRAKKMVMTTGVNDLDALVAGEKEKLRSAHAEAISASYNLSHKTEFGNVESVKVAAELLKTRSREMREQSEFVIMIERDANAKREKWNEEQIAAAHKEAEEELKGIKEADEANKKKAESAKKFVDEQSKLQRDLSRSEVELNEEAARKKADIMAKDFRSRFDRADSYATSGGQIGRQNDAGIRSADIAAQRQAELLKVTTDMRDKITKLEATVAGHSRDAAERL